MAPRRVMAHSTWRHVRAIFIAFLSAFNGTNIGEKESSIKAIGSGNQGLSARIVAELCEKGLRECKSEANRAHSKAAAVQRRKMAVT
jgi:hypothetical protein